MMKLKIDKIQELIDGIDYVEKPRTHLLSKDEDGAYSWISRNSDECLYQAQAIVNNIISYHINNIHNRTFLKLYTHQAYDDITDKSWGLYLDIPFFKVSHADVVYNDWYSDTREELSKLSSELDSVHRRIQEEKGLIEHYGYGNNYSSQNYEYHISKLEWLEKRIPYLEKTIKPLSNSINDKDSKKEIIWNQYKRIAGDFEYAQQEKINEAQKHRQSYIENDAVSEFLCFILKDSFYPFEFDCSPKIDYNKDSKLLVVDYYLPTIDEIPNIKEIKEYKTKENEIKYLSNTELNRLYDELIYKIFIRSVAEIFHFDDLKKVDVVCFNGRVKSRNPATGQLMDNCILSVQISRQKFESIDLNYVDCKACFKHFKGVSGAKLHDMSPIVPLIQLDTTDKRFVESHSVATDESTNLATMDWEEFEHLVRELFDLEFNVNGGEVKITQASRDGGVDAVAFDPDPIRGGKIVIQAKRYTNTVGVSAVRDLYGTVINEGANKGILITTSDYGADSYNFAKGKPITLLNGGHLLFLLEKHNKKARIDLKEATEQ